ncbi:hypothetical protein [Novosphingobium sp. TH158]|uniref:hypothetical protein n=1 Tax=Novosphingobium sp. TH158 TaxID=2067455 RepID=UPI001181BF21|nr:hypothetical protein [Novosphingobium sp. TH158]
MRLSFCWLNRHTPTRDRARWDGTHFISTCRNCGKPIRRVTSKVWRKEWMPEGSDNAAWL